MQEFGKIKYVANPRTGVSTKTGETWASQVFVIETIERYPRQIAFELFGVEKIEVASLKLGEEVNVVFYCSSHEFGGNWYTELRVIDILQNNRSRLVKGI